MIGLGRSKQALTPADINTWILAYTFTLLHLNASTSLLIAFRIWSTICSSSQCFTSELAPVARIVIESAIFQLIAEVLLLVVYFARSNGHTIILDAVVPIIVSRLERLLDTYGIY